MSENFIEAMIAAAERVPGAGLVVASETRPCVTTLAGVVTAGRRMGTRLAAALVRFSAIVLR